MNTEKNSLENKSQSSCLGGVSRSVSEPSIRVRFYPKDTDETFDGTVIEVLPTVLPSHDELSVIVAKWLKKHDQNILIPNCATIAIDLKTLEQEKPDVIGWSGSCSILIEVKVSRSDFLCDSKKPFRKHPEIGVGQYRYYCCPYGLIKENELPENWGLLYLSDKNKIEIIKVADIQKSNMIAERNILISMIRRLS